MATVKQDVKRKKQRDPDEEQRRAEKVGINRQSNISSMEKNIEARNVAAGFDARGKQFLGAETAAKQQAIAGVQEQIKADPTQFGLMAPGQNTQPLTPEQMAEFQVTTTPGSIFPPVGSPEQQQFNAQLTSGYGQALGVGSLVAGGGEAALALKGFKVGGRILGAKKAVQLGNAAKNTASAASTAATIRDFAIGAFASLKAAEGVSQYFTGRKIDEQQQAVNTLGQLATTIGGQATEASGDWQKGLQELDYLESTILELEEAMKAGTIASASLKFNGKIYDVNADIQDQLATIAEQKSIIQSFVLTNSFPELSDLEIQQQLRQLESEGYIEPVDFTTSRRDYETKQQTEQTVPESITV